MATELNDLNLSDLRNSESECSGLNCNPTIILINISIYKRQTYHRVYYFSRSMQLNWCEIFHLILLVISYLNLQPYLLLYSFITVVKEETRNRDSWLR